MENNLTYKTSGEFQIPDLSLREKIEAIAKRVYRADGVDFEYGLGVAELTPDGPLFRERTFDAEGNVVEEGEPALYPADTTIIAASQTTKSKIVNTTTGLALNDKGLIAVHGNVETSREGVFSGGDVVLGPWNVIQTVKNSKLVAEAMDRYLTAKRGE